MATIGAIDIALWDLYGRSCGEPVWRLLGGFRDRVQVYADGIGYVEDQDAEGVAALVKKHADQGYGAVKFHLVASDPDLALEKVRLSREVLGPDLRLMVDVHGVWDGVTCVEMARRFNPYHLYWLEEPVQKDDEIGFYRMVREASNALIAGGEGEGTLYGAQRLIADGGLQVLQTDIVGGGGYTGLLRMAAVAEAHHAYIAPHGASYPDLNCHFLAGVPNGLMVPACPETEPYQIWSKMYKPRFEVKNGEVAMTDKPGLGLELDEAFVREYRV
jgi:L-alanine-DL-glutamate epimerase-like enolase superfamily enzyme